jgi:ribosome-associated protein
LATKRVKPLQTRTVARRAVQFAADKKAVDIVLLDMRKVTDIADYFLICTGVVDAHVRAIVDNIDHELSQLGWEPRHVEGRTQNRWVLVDYVDIIVHVLQPDARGYFAIERLWGDAARVKVKGVTD